MKCLSNLKCTAAALLSFAVMTAPMQSALACTRAMYVGPNDMVITTRTNDWLGTQKSNLWIFPAAWLASETRRPAP